MNYFYTTPLRPCPYIKGLSERRIITELDSYDTEEMHDLLTLNGFRRSHGLAYTMSCPGCTACIPMRINCADFTLSRSQRRLEKINDSTIFADTVKSSTREQYALFKSYQVGRHDGGEMSKMTFYDYQGLSDNSPLETSLIEYRLSDGYLVAVCIIDRLIDGFSAVYSFYDPCMQKNSLGTYMILWLIRRSRNIGLRYLYMGFWIEKCTKMSYKSKFRPYEIFINAEWQQPESFARNSMEKTI